MSENFLSNNPSHVSSKSLGYVSGIALIVFPIAVPIITYIDRVSASHLLKSHYTYNAGTFWKAMAIGAILSFLWISFMMMMFVIPALGLLSPLTALGFLLLSLWYVVRAVKSVVLLHRDQEISAPRTWGI